MGPDIVVNFMAESDDVVDMQSTCKHKTSLFQNPCCSVVFTLSFYVCFNGDYEENQENGFCHDLRTYFDSVCYFVVLPKPSDSCRLRFSNSETLIHLFKLMKTNSNQKEDLNQSKVSVLCDSIVEKNKNTTSELTLPKNGQSRIGHHFDQSPLKFLS